MSIELEFIEDISLVKLTALCVFCVLLLMALYASSVNKDDASKYRVLLRQQEQCMAQTEGQCYMKVISSKDLNLLTEQKIKEGRKYGIY